MTATVILIRHGQSTFNAHFEATGTDPGHVDARLTDTGHRQAAEARAKIAAFPRPDLVISTPLTRALQTTLGIFGGSGIPVMAARPAAVGRGVSRIWTVPAPVGHRGRA